MGVTPLPGEDWDPFYSYMGDLTGNPYQPPRAPQGYAGAGYGGGSPGQGATPDPRLSGASPNPWLANYLKNLFTAQNPNAPRPVPPNSGATPNPLLANAILGGAATPANANAATIPNGQLTAAPGMGPPTGGAGGAWLTTAGLGNNVGGYGQGPFAGQPTAAPGAGTGQGPFAGRPPGPMAPGGPTGGVSGAPSGGGPAGAGSRPAASPGPPAGMWDWQVPGMGRGGQLPITAANWGGLFNRGGPAIGSPAPAVPPARPQGPMGGAPMSMGPVRPGLGYQMPTSRQQFGPPLPPGAARAALLNPNYYG